MKHYPRPRTGTFTAIDISISREDEAAIQAAIYLAAQQDKWKRPAETQLTISQLCDIRTFDARQNRTHADAVRFNNMAHRINKQANEGAMST